MVLKVASLSGSGTFLMDVRLCLCHGRGRSGGHPRVACICIARITLRKPDMERAANGFSIGQVEFVEGSTSPPSASPSAPGENELAGGCASDPAPCNNGGVCVDNGAGGHYCECTAQWTGMQTAPGRPAKRAPGPHSIVLLLTTFRPPGPRCDEPVPPCDATEGCTEVSGSLLPAQTATHTVPATMVASVLKAELIAPVFATWSLRIQAADSAGRYGPEEHV
jgi:hypothetical protein